VTPGKLKVLVADDHALIRSGIRRLLQDEPDIDYVGEAETASQALQRVRDEDWNVVIMDIDMPGQSTRDVLPLIKREKPTLPVLILTMHPENQYAVRMLKDGASGYLTKASAPENLIIAIRKVVGGGAYVSEALALQLTALLKWKHNENPHDHLTDREISVLCAIAEGKSLAAIAEAMHLSAKTITTYRKRVLDKLHLQSNTDLMRYALGHGLIH
jgi:DNA-binding NarL/FixJ family response regulator